PFDHRLELTDLRHFERPAHNLLDQRLGQREKIAVVQYLVPKYSCAPSAPSEFEPLFSSRSSDPDSSTHPVSLVIF
ncbi:hypothetical protein NL492_26995, partial [Klebsiella pneumoniae]|nr:hypothetical protein [Klebsiella pneumoniae]